MSQGRLLMQLHQDGWQLLEHRGQVIVMKAGRCFLVRDGELIPTNEPAQEAMRRLPMETQVDERMAGH